METVVGADFAEGEADSHRSGRTGAYFARDGGAGLPIWLSLCCLAFSALFVVAVSLIFKIYYPMTGDEQTQALFASARFLGDTSNYLMPYSLILVSGSFSVLYRLLPGVPWYPLVLLGLIAVSYAVSYAAVFRSRLSAPARVAVLAVLAAFEFMATLYLTFTIVAFLAFSAGLVLILERATFEVPGGVHVGDIGGLLLVCYGYSLRPESALAALVIFAPFAVWVLARNRNVGSIARGVIVLACIGGCTVAGQMAYRSAAGWESYSEYLEAGRSSLDYPDLTDEEVESVDSSLSDNDVDMLYNWMFADNDVFSIDFFKKLSSKVEHFGFSNLINSLRAKLTYALLGMVVLMAAAAWFLTSDIGRTGDVRVLAFGCVLMLLLNCCLLIMRARVRIHVVLPLLMTAFFALCVCVQAPVKSKPESNAAGRAESGVRAHRARLLAPVLACFVAVAVCGAFWAKVIRPLSVQASSSTFKATQKYVKNHPDTLFVYARTTIMLYVGMDAFEFEEWEYPDNALPVSGWESNTASWNKFLASWNLTNKDTLQQLAKRDDMLAIMQPSKMKILKTYLEEHSGKKVRVEVVENLGPGAVDPSVPVKVYRFSYAG